MAYIFLTQEQHCSTECSCCPGAFLQHIQRGLNLPTRLVWSVYWDCVKERPRGYLPLGPVRGLPFSVQWPGIQGIFQSCTIQPSPVGNVPHQNALLRPSVSKGLHASRDHACSREGRRRWGPDAPCDFSRGQWAQQLLLPQEVLDGSNWIARGRSRSLA